MTPEEIAFIYKHASLYGLGLVVAIAIVYLIGKHSLSSYLAEKGKNLATREDIKKITELVEEVKAPYNQLLEELRARHQLRLAAIDRRLQAHQESFTLWRQLLGAVHTKDAGSTVITCQEWWERNCLYLEPDVREAFVRAYTAVSSHGSLLQDRSATEAIKQNWQEIVRFPQVLFPAVQLPPLSELEKKAVESPPQQ